MLVLAILALASARRLDDSQEGLFPYSVDPEKLVTEFPEFFTCV